MWNIILALLSMASIEYVLFKWVDGYRTPPRVCCTMVNCLLFTMFEYYYAALYVLACQMMIIAMNFYAGSKPRRRV
jgi:hypothetical protein